MKPSFKLDAELKSAQRDGTLATPAGASWVLDVREWRERPWIGRVEDGVFTPLCTAFLITEGVRYPDQENRAALRVKVWTEEKTTQIVEIAGSEMTLRGGAEALAKLRNAGLLMAKQSGQQFVVGMLMESQPRGGLRFEKAGWRDGMFLPPIGPALFTKGRDVALSDDVRLSGPPSHGTLDGWKEGAAFVFASKAEPWQATLLAGFVGPIVSLIQCEAPVIILEGATSSGKSTGQAIAAAAWANPQLGAGLFTSLHGTVNSVEVQLARGSGTIAALDEGRFFSMEALVTVCFAAAGGQGKARLKSSGAARRVRTFNTPLLLSAETRTSQRLEQEGLLAPGGLAVRLTPISMASMPTFSPDCMAKARLILSNYGVAGPEFVRILAKDGYVQDPDKLRALLEAKLRTFKGVDNPIKRRAANGLALMATALEIAKDSSLLPQTATDAALHSIWHDFLLSEMAPADPVERAIEHLIDSLVSRRGLDVLLPDQERSSREAMAYIMESPTRRVPDWGERLYVVRTKAFSNMCGNIADDLKVRKELIKRGVAIRDPNNPRAIAWTGFPGLSRAQYMVLRADMVEASERVGAAQAMPGQSQGSTASITDLAAHRLPSPVGAKRSRF